MGNGSDPPLAPGCNMPGERLGAGGHLADLAACAGPRLLHAWWWRFGADWRLPERRVPNGMLYLPLSGRIVLAVDGEEMPVAPGQVAVLPEGLPQTGRYAAGAPLRFDAIVWHLLLPDAQGLDFLRRLPRRAHAIADWPAWRRRLVRAVLAFNGGGADGVAFAQTAVRLLLAELVAGCAAAMPAPPRLDARVARALAAGRDGACGSAAALARGAGLGERRFRDLFRAATGLAPKEWLARRRLAEAARRLRDPAVTVRAVAAELGFSSDHYFHACFRRAYGMAPTAWRRQPAGG